MKRNNILLAAIWATLGLPACSSSEPPFPSTEGEPKEVCFSATLQEMAVTKAGETAVVPTDKAPYYLYYTKQGGTAASKEIKNESTTGIFWDDVQQADNSQAFFQFSNVPVSGTLPTNKDIIWGEASAWNKDLTFKLTHRMSQFSIILLDQTNNNLGSIGGLYDQVKVSISQFRTDVTGFDPKTGTLTATAPVANHEWTLTKTEPQPADIQGVQYATPVATAYYPPQAIIGETLLITCGKYTYTVAMPKTMTGSTTSPTTTCLNPGEHLTLTVTLKETEIGLTATLTDWETVTAKELPINRLFNIASIDELKDFALAVNTGYDFKGMVVRLTKEISLSGSDIHIGNAQNPFRGIFDGNGMSLSDMGTTKSRYAGSLFGYADGATLRNVTFSSPYTQGQGVLVAEANNTVINNCTIKDGSVNGTTNYAGALAGNLSGRSSITNCYITGTAVSSTGDYVGGLVGKTEGSIAHSFATGTVTGGYFVGGLAGSAGGDVRNCYAWGDVSGSNNVGGLMGVTNSTLSHSYAAVTVTGNGQDKGGLLGSIGFNGKATNCYWTANDNGAGVVNLNGTNNCALFALGTDIITGKLDTGNPNVWENDANKKPVFK